eukprot:TRINITY_DN585_c0_g2_i1.p1 TRINITY_DN585_c0_g2~~TRINITY_DN585_c0_g2_i1.p1  ORF type:complete len:205 (-),score=29.37 TRINITY_DN585_c0_g2_i1:471-1085(-)
MADNTQRQKRLEHVVKSYRGDFEKAWNDYVKLCEAEGTTPEDLLTNVEYYTKFDFIAVSSVQETILKYTLKLKRSHDDKEDEPTKRRKFDDALAQREEAQSQRHGRSCRGCGGKKFMSLTASANDGNTFYLPSGLEGEDIDFPTIPSICEGKILSIEVCIDCGRLVGFDKDDVRRAIVAYEEQRAKRDPNDDELREEDYNLLNN